MVAIVLTPEHLMTLLHAVQSPDVKTFSVKNISKMVMVVTMKQLMMLTPKGRSVYGQHFCLTAYKAGNHADASCPYIITPILLCPNIRTLFIILNWTQISIVTIIVFIITMLNNFVTRTVQLKQL